MAGEKKQTTKSQKAEFNTPEIVHNSQESRGQPHKSQESRGHSSQCIGAQNLAKRLF